MKTLIGSDIAVYLKSTEIDAFGDVIGILLEVTESELYVQKCNCTNKCIYIIPRDNVKYCTVASLPADNKIIYQEQPHLQEEQETLTALDHVIEVYINNELATTIPVPPTFSLDRWNENIMRVLAGNADVKVLLAGKKQKAIDYYPGKVYIEIERDKVSEAQSNTFSMSKDLTTEYLNPSEMVMRFNSFLKKEE